MALRSIELFAGAGGLSLALRRLGARTVCYVERDGYAAGVVASRMADGRLDAAPLWSDVCTFDGCPWRGVVDLIAGGFPCQDVSSAGNGAGLDGERSGLWREYARILGEVRPSLVFVENVARLRSRGLDRVLRDLAALGFDAEWSTLRAADVGAPHLRDRLFLLAYTDRGRLEVERIAERGVVECEPWDLAHRHDQDGGFAWPPGPDDERWGEFLRLRPGTEPGIRRDADGLADRVDRLRLTGNGVVPTQAIAAFLGLARRAAEKKRGHGAP